MSSTLNASTTSGLVSTADLSGTLELQANGVTKATINSSGVTIPTLTATTVTGQVTGGAITSGTAVASTSGTSIDFTGIPSWVKRITVMFNAVSTSGTSVYLIQIGAGSVTSTGYYASSSQMSNSTSTGSTNSTAGFPIYENNATGNVSGAIVLTGLGSNIWIASGVTTVNTAYTSTTAGGITLSGTLDRVRITTVNGTDTFDAGSINLLYEG